MSLVDALRCRVCGALNPPGGWFCKQCHLNLKRPPSASPRAHRSPRLEGSGHPLNLPPHVKAALQTLGVDDRANRGLIQKAYRRLMKQYHPDRLGIDCAERQAWESRAREINAAYETLRSFYTS